MITYYVVVLVIRTHMVLPSILTHVITRPYLQKPLLSVTENVTGKVRKSWFSIRSACCLKTGQILVELFEKW